MAIYAVGDLQGCYDPFRRLLDKIRFDPDADTLWLTGDLVNRGPKSLKTLRFVRSLDDAVITVLGNHDLHLLAMAYGKRYTDAHYESLGKILNAPDADELCDWLSRRPLAHFDKSINTLMVHAGLAPQWSVSKSLRRAREIEDMLRGKRRRWLLQHMYGNRPTQWSGKLKGAARARFIVNVFTRTRMVYPDGRLNFTHSGPPEKARKGLIPWFEAPKARWRGTRVVFGHWSALGLKVSDDLLAIDTGCVWGRELTAVKLSKKPKIKTVSCAAG